MELDPKSRRLDNDLALLEEANKKFMLHMPVQVKKVPI